jgi:hypothetical protein
MREKFLFMRLLTGWHGCLAVASRFGHALSTTAQTIREGCCCIWCPA